METRVISYCSQSEKFNFIIRAEFAHITLMRQLFARRAQRLVSTSMNVAQSVQLNRFLIDINLAIISFTVDLNRRTASTLSCGVISKSVNLMTRKISGVFFPGPPCTGSLEVFPLDQLLWCQWSDARGVLVVQSQVFPSHPIRLPVSGKKKAT